MKWTKITLETTTEAVDFISDILIDLEIVGMEVEDNIPLSEEDRQRLFIDILPEPKLDDGKAMITFYLEADKDTNAFLLSFQKALDDISGYVSLGSRNIIVSDTEDKNWINNWKQFFKPFRVDDTIVIKPTWEEFDDYKEGDLLINIDPGTSFGTGSHETTKLCITGLKKYIKPGFHVLDAGSGSGILSIIAKKLGAKEVLGIDIDPIATDAAIENSMVNGYRVSENEIGFITGNILEDQALCEQIGIETFDIIVANILADVIIPLSDILGKTMKSGGIFISSGIINTKEAAVKDALIKNKFTILHIDRMGDWVSFEARK